MKKEESEERPNRPEDGPDPVRSNQQLVRGGIETVAQNVVIPDGEARRGNPD